ncbi:chromosome segregation protein SMC [Pelosinus sp. sgz500959]|uniref:chromosome segregation protein SMC n=1 Tax=Pelosinus sp. sgz500959 TaxID=3242472 RepID=UPI0036730BCE
MRRLEAYGFKSFADKTEIEFGPGITVVVGPNGSGKSNISDAIRWVLGEQSIRTLRGTRMEDVIFAGSSGRRPLGIAEVSLTFDNSDGTLPIEFSEVIITRRVFRSGDSEYFINKGLCRLKDIYELLADTGLGRDAMSVIGQNKVDEILNSKPEDRRLLFEETAGITKYKQRKKDAMRKLDDTTQNLIRVSDITNELAIQLVPLAESAERTKKYNKIQSELRSCQVTLLVNILEKSEKMVESATLQKNHLTEQDVAISTEINLKETEKIQGTTKLIEADEKLAFYANSMNQADHELERVRGKIAVIKERMIHSQRSKDRITDEQRRIEEQTNEITEKIRGAHDVLTSQQTLAKQLSQDLDDQNSSYNQITTEIQQVQQQLETDKEKTFNYLHEIVAERNKVTTIERDLIRIQTRQQDFEQEYQDHQEQLNHMTTAANTILSEQQAVKINLVELHKEQESIEKNKQIKGQHLQQIAQKEKQLLIQVNELNSRFKILSNMQNEYEGFARGIKSVLKSDASWHSGICGAVAQILTVPDQYVTAIEIALGGAVQHIITENAEIAKQAMYFLKTKNLGRATFLPLDTIKPFKPRDGEKAAANAPGSLGFAANLVSCEPRYRPIIESLLGRTIIVDHIDSGLKIAKEQGYSVKIVTLEGELLNPGGSMTGGSTNKRDSSFISRNNAITAITQNLDEGKVNLVAVQQQVESIQKEISEIEQEILNLQRKRQQTEVRQAEIAVHAEKIQLDIKRLTIGIENIHSEKVTCLEEEKQLKESLTQTHVTIATLEKRDHAHQEELTVGQQKHQELQNAKDELQKKVTDLKIELTEIQQKITAIVANCQQYEQSKQTLKRQLDQLEAESNELSTQALQADQDLAKMGIEQATLSEQKIKDEEQHKAQYETKLRILSTLQQLEKEIKELRRKSHDLQTRLHESELLATKYTYEVSNSREKLEQQFTLTIEEAKKICLTDHIGNISKLAKDLEKEILALGPVNHAALDEFTHLQTRYDFLQKQYQDLVSAKEYLASIISDIDKTMSEKFIESFTKINEYFSDIFIRLFGGGSAELKLIDPDNMLNTGIEIIVQPPGKKLQNLVLLSGGERTLTVIALLFAFLTYRPTPFIVVDEIDASLDEANVERLSQFLEDYSKHTQFIVVTHRKGTMEVATVMYGVTMEQSGVSRLISVKLMDKTG